MTIGKKLYLSFGAAFALTIALGATTLYSISLLSGLLRTAITSTAQKQKLAGAISTFSSQMLADDRGMQVRAFMKDMPVVDQYNQQFNEHNAQVARSLEEIGPLLEVPALRSLATRLQAGNKQLIEANAAVYDLASKGDPLGATKVYANRFLPLQKQVAEDADKLGAAQDAIFNQGLASAESATTSTRWLTGCMLIFSAAVAVCIIFVVMRINRLLRHSIADLGESVAQVASAATQIASTSQSLAQGSSEQAATIEETSATSSEINSMAQRNTENSRTTADMMTAAQERFVETNQSLQQMVLAMDGITASSQKISKIIKVIDEIAFQTNILALNAAVEAARAGEAGMGFAVVADEVRNLAQRCAQAAKDTADLIEDSIHKSNGGKAQLDQVADAFRLVASESSKMKILVDEINLGSIEQARGVDQITRSIVQMDQVTQSSAANAEQGAAAAQQLNAQSLKMQQVVLGLATEIDGASRHAPAPASRHRQSMAAPRFHDGASRSRTVTTFKTAITFPSPRPDSPDRALAVAADHSSFPLDSDFKEF